MESIGGRMTPTPLESRSLIAFFSALIEETKLCTSNAFVCVMVTSGVSLA
jgi:hypothetical protein